jgi:hypothetical protein
VSDLRPEEEPAGVFTDRVAGPRGSAPLSRGRPMADRTVTLPDDMAISYLDAGTPDGDVVLDVREVIRAMSTEAFR